MRTTERLEHALALAKRVLGAQAHASTIAQRDVADLAQTLVMLDGALARGAPFPATWCRAVPAGTRMQRTLQGAAAQARTRSVAIARRVLDARRPADGREALLMARSIIELHVAILRGGDVPPGWSAPPARFADASDTCAVLAG